LNRGVFDGRNQGSQSRQKAKHHGENKAQIDGKTDSGRVRWQAAQSCGAASTCDQTEFGSSPKKRAARGAQKA
jgi:hypothetical protein